MKTVFSLIVFLLSAKVMAHTCHISLYDPYNRPVLNFYSKQDLNCQAAAQRCYETISANRLNPYQYKCYTVSMTEDEVARAPQATAASRNNLPVIDVDDNDYRRIIKEGETVIYQGKFWVVSFRQENGLYQLKLHGGKKKDIEKDINRKDISITRGCLRNICTKTSFISKSSGKYVSIEGISFEGRYIVQDILTKELSFDVEFYNLARTTGCLDTRTGQICAGNTVLARDRNYYNRYFQVAGIQSDRMVVLKDDKGQLYFNVDPAALTVSR